MTGYYKQQSGVAMIIGLIILLLLTIIMIAAMRVTSLEERMAGNLRNHNIAFQAAESALREAEASIVDLKNAPRGTVEVPNPLRPFSIDDWRYQNPTGPVCVQGLCITNKPDLGLSGDSPLEPDEIDSMDFKVAATGIVDSIKYEPEYIIEYIGKQASTDENRPFIFFRITAKGWGGDERKSVVQLQSVYRVHVLDAVGNF
jgi:Tfp pilus assembly protein PilX